MKYFVVGLGNPGEEYKNTRHNTGREAVISVAGKLGAGEWQNDKKLRALTTTTKSGPTAKGRTDRGAEIMFVLPETMMN